MRLHLTFSNADKSTRAALRTCRALAFAALLGASAIAHAQGAEAGLNLRTDPAVVRAGVPFDVLVDGGGCVQVFLDDAGYGTGYQSLTVAPPIVAVRVGYYRTFFSMDCDNPPHTVRTRVPGLAAGTYQ